MSVMKFDKTPTPLEEVIKINEIIDNLGSGGGVGIRREEFTSSDWVEQQNGKYRYTIYGIKDVISVYRLYDGDYAFVGCDITNDDDNAYIDSPNAFDGFAYVASQEEVLGNRNIGAIIKSLIPQNDAGLHLLDGSLIQGNGIYEEFVNRMASLYGDGTNVPHYFTSESNWQNEVITYGCCGKFVYDSENNTVRLPKFERILQGTLLESELGDRIEAGAPNITGEMRSSGIYSTYGVTGAFTGTEQTTGESAVHDHTSNTQVQRTVFRASKSNSIYGNSNTIQPPVIKVLYYIVIATSKKTDIEVDIDNIVNDLDRKADKDLSNTGCVTNCLTSIPQDIKLELNNGTVTLKAGSKLYYPNGFEQDGVTKKFDSITLQSDVSVTPTVSNSNDLFLFYDYSRNGIGWRILTETQSGTSEPATGSGITYYNTDTNIITSHDRTDSRDWQATFPICLVVNVNGVTTEIKQVFNGFGFVGATLFALPGLKGLIPNGRNKDGTLKNIRFQTTEVMINIETRDTAKYIVIGYNDGQWQGDGRISSFVNNNYDEVSNYNYDRTGNIQPVFRVGKCSFSNGSYTQISKKEVLHVVDMNDISSLYSCIGFPDYSAGVSKSSNIEYTAESDGYIFAQVYHNAETGTSSIQVTINSSNIGFAPGATDYGRSQIYLPIKKGDVYKVVANDGIVFYPIRS